MYTKYKRLIGFIILFNSATIVCVFPDDSENSHNFEAPKPYELDQFDSSSNYGHADVDLPVEVEEEHDDKDDKYEKDVIDDGKLFGSLEKVFLKSCSKIALETYKEIVAITATHFIQLYDENDSKDALEFRVMKGLGKGFFKLIIECGKYGKRIISSPASVQNKAKKVAVIIGGLASLHLTLKFLINKAKSLQTEQMHL